MTDVEIEIEEMRGEGAGRRSADIQRVARDVFGWDPLRPGLARAVAAVLAGHDVLGVMPTGYGKSGAFRIAGALLPGTTVVVSPLIALQADQLHHLQETPGTRPAALINSAQPKGRTEEAWERLAAGELGYLFLAPEQLANGEVVDRLAAADVSLLTVDEAHCVSSWGHDFRPDYLRLGEVAERIGRPPILALTATGSRPVREEIVERLRMRDVRILTHGFDRPNIHLSVVRHSDEPGKREGVLGDVAELRKPGLLYVATRRDTDELAETLAARGIRAAGYHGGLPAGRRRSLSADFAAGDVDVMVATSAFGMGIDRADVRFVVHGAVPESVDEYYQEVGRAGRDGEPSAAVLHYRSEDLALRKFFASAVPKAGDLKRLLLALGRTTELAAAAKQAGLSTRRATALANLFEEAGVLRIVAGRAEWLGGDVEPEAAVGAAREQAESRRRIDESRLAMMRSYAETTQCRRQHLLAYFGDEGTELCHNCDTCDSGDAAAYAEGRDTGTADEPFPVDTAVTHLEWGEGRVMSVEDDRITVFFESEGYRVLSLEAVEERSLLERTDQRMNQHGDEERAMSDPGTSGPVDPDDPTISDAGTGGEAGDVGGQDPITGVPAGASNADLDADARLGDDVTADEDALPGDPEAVREESLQTVSNDAVAGETVYPGLGESNRGPTGGAAHELEPSPSTPVDEGLPENELAGQDIDLDDGSRTQGDRG